MIMEKNKEPLIVTIRCVTYNHEPFIRQCLDGFVMQKTNFRFEAIVHDDASTDRTAAIILEYAEKYPDIIRPIIETENQYSKHDGSLTRIMNEHTHGKYVALCEGDDYWTDPYKLQKQVDFLESHLDYFLCFHNAFKIYESSQLNHDDLFVKNDKFDRDYTGEEIIKDWIIPTASVLFRREIIESDLYSKVIREKRFLVGDSVLFLTAAHYGKIHYLNQVMSVYRKHRGGVTSAISFTDCTAWLAHNKALKHVFGNKYKIFDFFIFRSYTEVIKESLSLKKYIFFIYLVFEVLVRYPIRSFKYLFQHIFR